MQETYQTFPVGINVFVTRENRLLLGKRKNTYGAGTWGLPGGHLEAGEAMKAAAARELMEETGLYADSYEFTSIVNDVGRGEHYLQVGFVAKGVSGEAALKEPDRCEEWGWFDFDSLPQELFPPHIKQIENYMKKSNFSDA